MTPWMLTRPGGARAIVPALVLAVSLAHGAAAAPSAADDLLVSRAPVGRYGGQLIVNQRAEPRTLNPVTAIDSISRDVIKCTNADLIHINRETQRTEPALARTWSVSPDGRRYTLALRHGIRFSDGEPFDADDVLFSFAVYLDAEVKSPHRDLL